MPSRIPVPYSLLSGRFEMTGVSKGIGRGRLGSTNAFPFPFLISKPTASTDATANPTHSAVPMESATVVAIAPIPLLMTLSFSEITSMPFLNAFFFIFEGFFTVITLPIRAAVMSGLKAVVSRGGGSAGALKYITAGPSAAPLRAALATPAGRVAVVALTLGFAGGAEAAKNKTAQVTVLALGLIMSNENLSPAEKTRYAIETLRNAVTESPARPAPRDPYADRSWERSTPLSERLAIAKQTLAESKKLLASLSVNSDRQTVITTIKGQQASVDRLQRQLNESQVPRPKPTPNQTPTRTTPPGVKKSSTQPDTQLPAAISPPAQVKPSTRVRERQDNQIRQHFD